MKISWVFLFVPCSYAANFLPQRDATSLLDVTHREAVKNRKEMPVQKNHKIAGGGYQPGSPLYQKQEERKEQGLAGVPPPPPPVVPVSAAGPAPAAADDGSVIVKVTQPPEDKVDDPEHYHQLRGGWWGHFTMTLSYFLEFFVITVLCAFIWDKCKGRSVRGIDERKNLGTNFAYSLFSVDHCCGPSGHHSCLCLCAWMCPVVRVADTYSKKPMPLFKSFWGALILVTCLVGLNALTYGISGFIFLCLAVQMRGELRKQYGLRHGDCNVCMEDFLIWTCLPCCAIAQEARQVEFVLKPGSNES